MSNDNIYKRLFDLWTMICKMIMNKDRDPYKVAEVLQTIVDESKVYLRRLYETEVIRLDDVMFSVYEIMEDCTLANLLKSMNCDMGLLAFTSDDQIDKFCLEYFDKLRRGGYATLFLQKEGKKFFLVYVFVNTDGKIFKHEHDFSFSYAYSGLQRIRFVTLQQ